MAEVLDDLDWQGKVFSGGWTVPRGGCCRPASPGGRASPGGYRWAWSA
jgi:hypothetical protein